MGDNPFIKDARLVWPKRDENGGAVVIVERIEPGATPAYCVHGKVSCYWCDEWCWLGDKTYELVVSGDAAPMCRECGSALIPQDMTAVENVKDHRRADGPH